MFVIMTHLLEQVLDQIIVFVVHFQTLLEIVQDLVSLQENALVLEINFMEIF